MWFVIPATVVATICVLLVVAPELGYWAWAFGGVVVLAGVIVATRGRSD